MTHCHTTKSKAYKSARKPQVYAQVIMVLVMGIKIQLKLLVVGFCLMSVVWMPTSATKRKVRKRFRILNGIVGGEETAANGYPWQARLEDKVSWCYQLQMLGNRDRQFKKVFTAFRRHTLSQKKMSSEKKCTNFLKAPACSPIPP